MSVTLPTTVVDAVTSGHDDHHEAVHTLVTDRVFTAFAAFPPLIPTNVTHVRTTGYSVNGVGPAPYVYDAAVDAAYVTANPRTSFRALDGRGFRLTWGPNDKVNPWQFGCLGGIIDDNVALQAFWDFISATNVGTADVGGAFSTSVAHTFGLSTTPLTRKLTGLHILSPTAGTSGGKLLTFKNFNFGQGGAFVALGPGSTSFASRTWQTAFNFDNSGTNEFEYMEAQHFAFAAVYMADNNDSQNSIGTIVARDCGSGHRSSATPSGTMYGLSANWSNPVNSGTAGSASQATTINVDTLPPAWILDGTYGAVGSIPLMLRITDAANAITGVTNSGSVITATVASTANLFPGQTIGVSGITGFTTNNPNGTVTVRSVVDATHFTYVFTDTPTGSYTSGGTVWSTRLHWIQSVDSGAGTVTVQPWINSGVTSGVADYVFGSAYETHGGNTSVEGVDQIDATRCATGATIAGAYGPNINRIVAQFCGAGVVFGRAPSGLTAGGEVSILYVENCIEEAIALSRPSGVVYNEVRQTIAATPAKSYVVGTSRLSDNTFSSAFQGFDRLPITFNGRRHQYEKRPRLGYVNASVVSDLNRSDMHVTVPRDTVSITATLDFEIHRLFGYDSIRYSVVGTGGSGQPTGTVTFTAPAGYTINGGAGPVVFSGLTKPGQFLWRFDTVAYNVIVTLLNP